MATADYSTLAPHREAQAIIEGKDPAILANSKAAAEFWTKRNITRLANAYEQTRNLLHTKGHESLHIMGKLFNQLEEIHAKALAHEEAGQSLTVRRGLTLMSAAEIDQFEVSARARLHQLALREFEDPKVDHIRNLSVSFSTSFLESNLEIQEACQYELLLRHGKFNFKELETLKESNATIQGAFSESRLAYTEILELMQTQYGNQIALIKQKGLTAVSVYKSWIFDLGRLVSKVQSKIGRMKNGYSKLTEKLKADVEAVREKYSEKTAQMQANIEEIQSRCRLSVTAIDDLKAQQKSSETNIQTRIETSQKKLASLKEQLERLEESEDLGEKYSLESRKKHKSFVNAAEKKSKQQVTTLQSEIKVLLEEQTDSKLKFQAQLETLESQHTQLSAIAESEIEKVKQDYSPVEDQIKEEVLELETQYHVKETQYVDSIASYNRLLLHVTSVRQPRLHLQAHKECLLYLETNAYINRLMAAETAPLFKPETSGSITLYDSETNAFVSCALADVSSDQVKSTLNEISKLVHLISYKHTNMIEMLLKSTGHEKTPGDLIKALIEKMEEIESSFYAGFIKSLRNPKIAQKTKEELIAFLKSQIQEAIDSLGSGDLLDKGFEKHSAPLFCLRLTNDLNLVSKVIPEKFRVGFLQILSKPEKEKEAALVTPRLKGSAKTKEQRRAVQSRARVTQYTHAGQQNTMVVLQEKESIKRQVGKACGEAIKYLEKMAKLPNPSKWEEMTTFTTDFHELFPEALFYFELLSSIQELDCLFQVKRSDLKSKLVAIASSMVTHYLIKIRPYEASGQDLTDLQSVMVIPQGKGTQTPAQVQQMQLGKLQKSFLETLTMGLRFYHTHLALLTNYLDWSDEELNAMFLDHFLKLEIMEQKGSKREPNARELEAHKKAHKNLPRLTIKATKSAQEFRAVLNPYRQVQTAAYLFFGDLANLLIKDPSYLNLPDLTTEDIDMLSQRIDKIDTQLGVFDLEDQSVAQAIKNYLPAIKKIIEESSSENVVKQLTHFFETPQEGSTEILAYKNVSVLRIKLIIKILKISDAADQIENLNLKAMNTLFTQSGTSWKKYTKATVDFVAKQSPQKFDKFKSGARIIEMKRAAYNPEKALEYFKATKPFMVHQGVVNSIFLKWPAFKDDLTKRFAHDELGPLKSGIEEAAKSFNTAEETAEKFR
ncbi:MAG: hypothetical protein S4CHLAM6_01770 [Chlamydiae bacterium]|nr:hypothetical protein [Chlamydiota bacterium]